MVVVMCQSSMEKKTTTIKIVDHGEIATLEQVLREKNAKFQIEEDEEGTTWMVMYYDGGRIKATTLFTLLYMLRDELCNEEIETVTTTAQT